MHMIKKRYLSAALLLFLVLGSFKGYIALFDEGAEEPRQIFPYQVTSLPPDDQAALEEGILIRNDTQLNQLLEDYLS